MKRIENIDDLRAEIQRLKKVADNQKLEIRNDISEIRNDLKPENLFWNAISSVTGIRISKNEFLKDGVAYGLSLIIQKFILKTERKVEGKIYDFVDSVFERIQHFVGKFTNHEARRSERQEQKEDVVEDE